MAVIQLRPDLTFPISACGFDLDGVLRDTGYLAYENVCRAAADLGGRAPTYADFVHDWGGLLFTYFREHCGVNASDTDIRAVNDKYLQVHDLIGPYDDVESTIRHLSSLGVELFALSGHAHTKVQAWFTEHALHAHFVEVRGDGKDKLQQLHELRERFSKGKFICYVGDWGQDMRSAHAAGMIPIGIMRGQNTSQTLSMNGAAVVIDHLHDLTSLIK